VNPKAAGLHRIDGFEDDDDDDDDDNDNSLFEMTLPRKWKSMIGSRQQKRRKKAQRSHESKARR